jgi:hypothetical protein
MCVKLSALSFVLSELDSRLRTLIEMLFSQSRPEHYLIVIYP